MGREPAGGGIITRTPIVHMTSQKVLLFIQPFVLYVIIIIIIIIINTWIHLHWFWSYSNFMSLHIFLINGA